MLSCHQSNKWNIILISICISLSIREIESSSIQSSIILSSSYSNCSTVVFVSFHNRDFILCQLFVDFFYDMDIRFLFIKNIAFSLILRCSPFFFPKKKICFLFCMYVYVYMHVCTHVCKYPRRPEEVIQSPVPGVIDSCQLPNMDAGNWIWILWKSSMC